MNNETSDVYVKFEFAILAVLLPIIVVLGIFGNIALLFTTLRPEKFWLRLKLYIIFLSIIDILLLLISLNVFCLPVWLLKRVNESIVYQNYYLSVTPSFQVVNLFCIVAHIWATILLTVQRYLAICYPLQQCRWQSKRMFAALLPVVCFVALIYAVPHYFELEVKWRNESQIYDIDYSAFGSDNSPSLFYLRTISKATIMGVVPTIILWCMTIRIIWTIRNAFSNSSNHGQMYEYYESPKCQKNGSQKNLVITPAFAILKSPRSSTLVKYKVNAPVGEGVSIIVRRESSNGDPEKVPLRKKEILRDSSNCRIIDRRRCYPKTIVEAYKVLVIVPLSALCCFTLPPLLDIYEHLHGGAVRTDTTFLGVTDVSNTLVVTNAALNFYIYLFCCRRFRRHFYSIFCGR